MEKWEVWNPNIIPGGESEEKSLGHKLEQWSFDKDR